MKIILIRHGKAEDRSFDLDDSKRELTKEGHKKLKQNMPYLNEYLKDGNVKVFSSPLVRAYQTADYLEREYEKVDFLATGDYTQFIESIINNLGFDTLVYVGHEPILSIWTQQLTGQMIEVKKGMAVEFEWPDQLIRSIKLKDYQYFK